MRNLRLNSLLLDQSIRYENELTNLQKVPDMKW